MFYAIRKVILTACVGVVATCTAWVGLYFYQHRELAAPLINYAGRWKEGKAEPPRASVQLRGKVIKVLDGNTLQFRGPSGFIYTFGLTGVEVPNPKDKTNQIERKLGQESKDHLSALIASQPITADVTYFNQNRSGLGVIYLGNTNVNLAMVEAGMAKVNETFIKNLTLQEQFALVTAQKKAREQKLGIWLEQ